MAQIAWTDEALRWLEDIFEYIAADNPDAANRTVEGISSGLKPWRSIPNWAIDISIQPAMSASCCMGITASPISSRETETWTFSECFTTRSTSRSISCE